MKKKKQDEKVKLNKTNKQKENPIKDFPGKEIDLTKFNLLSDKAQYDEIKKVLEDIYKDSLKVNRKHVMKVISLTFALMGLLLIPI